MARVFRTILYIFLSHYFDYFNRWNNVLLEDEEKKTHGEFTVHSLIANFSFCAKKKRESSKSSYNWFFSVPWCLFSMNVRFFLLRLLLLLLVRHYLWCYCVEQIKALKVQTKYAPHEKINLSILFFMEIYSFLGLWAEQILIQEIHELRSSITCVTSIISY